MRPKREKHLLLKIYLCFVSISVTTLICPSYQQESLALKTDPFHIDLYHKFNSNQDFKPRGSILVRSKSEQRVDYATIINQWKLNESDIDALRESSKQGGIYYLRAALRKKGSNIPDKITQTVVKSCSLYNSNLVDFITINLNPLKEFINVNLFTADPECNQTPDPYYIEFNTTVLIDTTPVGPSPDTETYSKRLEEERQNKLKESKESNQSFFAKYWIYIVPAVVILMLFSGPSDQGGR